jgi:hypothetical protein
MNYMNCESYTEYLNMLLTTRRSSPRSDPATIFYSQFTLKCQRKTYGKRTNWRNRMLDGPLLLSNPPRRLKIVWRDTDEGCGKPVIELKKKRKEKKKARR